MNDQLTENKFLWKESMKERLLRFPFPIRLSNKSYEALPLGTQASRLRGPRKQREVGCSLRAFWNKTKCFAVIFAPHMPLTNKKRLPNLTC